MAVKTVRKIVKIDEEKCNGCGVCVPSCVEGALKIIDGKARLVSESYCDGLGACLGECPQGAITIEEREVEGFDEEAVKHYHEHEEHDEDKLACGCPSATVTEFHEHEVGARAPERHIHQPSTLRHWPVQLTLVPIKAPFLPGADVLLAADCVPFAYGGFHQEFLKDHALLVACPKLDDFDAHLDKLTRILVASDIKSLTVVHMEVPCCSGLVFMAKKAIEASGKKIPLKEVTIGVNGDLKD
jgi:ferredoxin